MSSRHDHAVAQVGPWVPLQRRPVKGNHLLVVPQQTARNLDLTRDFTTNEALIAHAGTLGQSRGTFPNAGPGCRLVPGRRVQVVDNFLLGAVSVAFGLYLIIRRKQFAARTIRQQNWFWRTNYGARESRHNERAAIVIGVFAFGLALMLWFA
jgi:hypothetical protein